MRTLRTASSLTSRNMSAAPPARTLMPFHYLGSCDVSQESGPTLLGSISSLSTISPSTSGGCDRLLQIPCHHTDIVWKCHFGLEQIGVPDFLPFETVVARVADLAQGLHLALYRNVSLSGKHILPFLARRDRILEMRVSDPRPQFRHGMFGLLVTIDVSMVRIPE